MRLGSSYGDVSVFSMRRCGVSTGERQEWRALSREKSVKHEKKKKKKEKGEENANADLYSKHSKYSIIFLCACFSA